MKMCDSRDGRGGGGGEICFQVEGGGGLILAPDGGREEGEGL